MLVAPRGVALAVLVMLSTLGPALALSPPTAAPIAGEPLGAPVGGSTSPAHLLAFSPQEPSLPLTGGQGRLLINTTDAATMPNTGIETNITDYATTGLMPDSSFQVAAEEVIGGYDAVFGLFQNSVTYPVPFFGVFSNLTDQTVHLAYWSNLTLAVGTSYLFALTRENGTNWTLRVNGELFAFTSQAATFDFGAPEATWVGGLGFSEVALYAYGVSTPDLVSVPLTFATQTSSGWHLPQEARAVLVTAQDRWGAVGRAQDGMLAPGEITTGLSVANFTDGTELWTTGPVSVAVALTLTVPSAPGMYPVQVFFSVAFIGGAEIPGVPLSLSDSGGGRFSPANVVTNANGGASAVLITPNVSATSNDLLTATVTLLGFRGSSSAAFEVDPAAQVLLAVTPAPVVVTAGTGIDLVLHATTTVGDPVGGLLLLLSTIGGVAQFDSWVTTNASGLASVVFSPAVGSPSLVLAALVAAPGYWGHATFAITVRAAPPSGWAAYAPYIELVVVGSIAAVVLVYLYRERRRRRPIPTLGSVLDPTEAREGSVSRTPPSEGAP